MGQFWVPSTKKDLQKWLAKWCLTKNTVASPIYKMSKKQLYAMYYRIRQQKEISHHAAQTI